jgi:hypothetical protein
MATYVNDLRLKEISTGDESGTWGTSTNTNLELIGEALGYATQQVFGSDADATTTIADGASDPARAMYFKITSAGSLTATRTCTIAPNTISRVMFIENATSGSQSIAISQGSGANVTIATGKTAVVYLDGAGATAAVVDAMAGVDPGVTDTLTEVLVAGNATGGTDIAVGTGDDITFADSSKAIFGAGSDLQIYHDGSGSFISDQGAGPLNILTSGFNVINPGNTETLIDAVENGAVQLYYDNAAKLATTATGIDVTGTVTATGTSVFASLDISGDIDVAGTTNLDVVDIDGAVDMATTLTVGGTTRINAEVQITAASGKDRFTIAPQAAGSGTFLISFNEAASNYEPVVFDFENINLRTAGVGRFFIDSNGVVLNEDSTAQDFRVESDDNANMLFVDGGANHVNIGTATDLGGTLNVLGNTAISGTAGGAYVATGATLSIQGTGTYNSNYFGSSLATVAIRSNEPANDGWNPTLHITTIRQSLGTNENSTGGIGFTTVDDSNNTGIDDAARIQVINLVGSSATSATGLVFYNNVGGSKTQASQAVFKLAPTEAVFNEDSADIDFRVESDANTHMLFVDGGNNKIGINESHPAASLDIRQSTDGNTDGLLVRPQNESQSMIYSFLGMRSTYFTHFVTDSANSGNFEYFKFFAGTEDINGELLQLHDDGATFNEGGLDRDFRVESDTNANMLFVDASTNHVGIGTPSPGHPLSIRHSDKEDPQIHLETFSYGSSYGVKILAASTNEAGTVSSFSSIHKTTASINGRSDVLQHISFVSSTVADDFQKFNCGDVTQLTISGGGSVTVAGALSKGSGSFKIDHPLPAKTETHNLVHSFIEGPQADNIYRGKVTLVDGSATVNIDTVSGMSEGTYVLLNTNTQCFTSNESGWTAVKGSVAGNILTIEAQESCSDTISWMVVGERHDQHMLDTKWTDENGKVIVEPLKELES